MASMDDLMSAARAFYNAMASGDKEMEACATQQLHRAAFRFGEREMFPRASLVVNKVVRRSKRP